MRWAHEGRNSVEDLLCDCSIVTRVLSSMVFSEYKLESVPVGASVVWLRGDD